MSLHLLTHVNEVLPRKCVIDHDRPSTVLERLVREVGALVPQVVKPLRLLGQHHREGLICCVGDFDRFVVLRARDLPIGQVLEFLPEKLLLLGSQCGLESFVFIQGLTSEPMSFFEAFCLLATVFKPRAYFLVNQFARVKDEVAILYHHIRNPLVEICDLGDLGSLKQVSESVDLAAHGIVVVSDLVGLELQLLRLGANELVDAFVLICKSLELVAKGSGAIFLLNFDLTSQCPEIVDVLGSMVFLNCEQLNVEGFLVGLL